MNIEVVMAEGKRMWSNTHWLPKLPLGNATHHFFPYLIGQSESDILARVSIGMRKLDLKSAQNQKIKYLFTVLIIALGRYYLLYPFCR